MTLEKKEVKMMIGQNIQRIRKKKGLTLSELAERASISKSYLSNIERNLNHNPSIHVLEKLAAVLQVDLHLLTGSEPGPLPDKEWLVFIEQLKESGVEKEDLPEYKTVIDFIKWQNKKLEQEK